MGDSWCSSEGIVLVCMFYCLKFICMATVHDLGILKKDFGKLGDKKRFFIQPSTVPEAVIGDYIRVIELVGEARQVTGRYLEFSIARIVQDSSMFDKGRIGQFELVLIGQGNFNSDCWLFQ